MRLFHLLILVCLAAAITPGWAQVSIHINVPGLVQSTPPPLRYEAVPRSAPNQVWMPGHWAWNDRQYAWQPGHLQRARIDYIYAPGRWMPADGGWRWSEETWRPKSKQRRDRQDEREDRSRNEHRIDDSDRYHCPPGQAKKGRC
jgi:hypothetical protein